MLFGDIGKFCIPFFFFWKINLNHSNRTCCSDQVFENMRKTISGPEELNGWNELREDDQERVRRGWNEGSIPDNERPDPAYPKEAK